jgi:uncharacterized membrane protein
MEVNYLGIIISITNIVLLVGVFILIYKVVQSLKIHLARNKEMDKKIDIILDRLDKKDDVQ